MPVLSSYGFTMLGRTQFPRSQHCWSASVAAVVRGGRGSQRLGLRHGHIQLVVAAVVRGAEDRNYLLTVLLIVAPTVAAVVRDGRVSQRFGQWAALAGDPVAAAVRSG